MTRTMKPLVLLVTLLSLAPAAGCSAVPGHHGSSAAARDARAPEKGAAEPQRRAATPEELERYAAREQRSAGLEKFEGGRIDTTAIIIILLLVIIIVILI